MRRTKLQRPVYRGQTLVEFALVLPLVLIVTMGIIQYGIIYYATNSITNISREGARFAATAPSSDAAIDQHIQNKMPPNINYGDITITILPAQGTVARNPGDPSSPGLISVTVSYPISKKLFLPSTFLGVHIFNQTFTATTEMMMEP